MGLAKGAIVFLMMIMVGISGLSMAAVYKVGDSVGWTILGGGLNYQDWAATKKFFVGDILVFEYKKQLHNVTQVNVEDYESCNPESPITRYGKGSDAISLASSGEYYFLCGYPGHCQAGQKLHITVHSAASLQMVGSTHRPYLPTRPCFQAQLRDYDRRRPPVRPSAGLEA